MSTVAAVSAPCWASWLAYWRDQGKEILSDDDDDVFPPPSGLECKCC